MQVVRHMSGSKLHTCYVKRFHNNVQKAMEVLKLLCGDINMGLRPWPIEQLTQRRIKSLNAHPRDRPFSSVFPPRDSLHVIPLYFA